MSIFTSVLSGGANNHETTAEEVNALATDFVSEGVVGAITNTGGVAPATGGFAVNAQGSPAMAVDVTAGVAYVTATPTGGSSQTLRVKSTATEEVTIAANSTGSTRYDWIYIKIDPDKAADPAADGSDVATLVTSRSTSSSSDDGTPPTYGYPIAVVTVANGASSITNANITDLRELATSVQDGSVTPAKLDSDAIGHGFLEIKRTTLSSAGDTITLSSIPARKYLRVVVSAINSGQLGTLAVTFNSDTGNNYAVRVSNSGAADTTSTSRANIPIMTTAGSYPVFAELKIVNIAEQEKLVMLHDIEQNTAGAANAPIRTERTGKWANTSNQITTITVTQDGTGDFAAGSEVVVYGSN